MSTVHPSAAIGFDRGAVDYERGRPGYPLQAIDQLAVELGLGAGRRVVDLAAGTGKLTRALLGTGADVIAVEPVAGMRAQLRLAVPDVEVLDGTAERLPLPDATVDVVLVAQAFHWFDVEAAASEIARVLIPGGGLGVIRNEWDRSVPWVQEVQAALEALRGDEPSAASSRWRERLDQTGRFTGGRDGVVPNPVPGDLAKLLARVASISFVAALDQGPRDELLHRVGAIVERHDLPASFTMPMRTVITYFRRAGDR